MEPKERHELRRFAEGARNTLSEASTKRLKYGCQPVTEIEDEAFELAPLEEAKRHL